MSEISERIETDRTSNRPKRAKREAGSGCLIPPRPGITAFWTAQVYDKRGKIVRRSTKVRGQLVKPDANPKLETSWTNVTAARVFLKDLIRKTDAGTLAVGSDSSQMHYADLRKLYLNDYTEQEHKSLMQNTETGEAYVCGLNHLDQFFGFSDDNPGMRVSVIDINKIDQFKTERNANGAANATVNRSLAALRRMFSLAQEAGILQNTPFIKMLPEPKQPRGGFLELEDYERLYAALDGPSAYIQPLLQIGFYTGMRLSEILGLTWSNVDLKDEMIRLGRGTTKNDEARNIPMIDGLPEMFEKLRRANPKAGENDKVFRGRNGKSEIGSFIKAWRNACVKAAIKTTLNGKEEVSHFEEDGTYVGFLFHDLRRSAIRSLIRAGVNQTVAKKISGHKTDAVFERYNITSTEDLKDAAEKVSDHLAEQRKTNSARETKIAVVR